MIKNLSLKFLLVSLVLVVSVIITSSCYAFSTEYIAKSPVTIEDLKEASGKTFSEDTIFHVIGYKNISTGNYNIYLLYESAGGKLESAEYFYPRYYNSKYYINCYCATDSFLRTNIVTFNYTDGVLNCETAAGNSVTGSSCGLFTSTDDLVVCDITTLPVRTAVNGTVIYEPFTASVEVTHEFQSDTSAKVSFDYSSYGDTASVLKYSLTGVEISTDLTVLLQLRNPVTYTPRSNKFSC